MTEQQVGLISVMQRIATAIENNNEILIALVSETMDIHDTFEGTNVKLNEVIADLDAVNKFVTEQLRVLKMTLPKEG